MARRKINMTREMSDRKLKKNKQRLLYPQMMTQRCRVNYDMMLRGKEGREGGREGGKEGREGGREGGRGLHPLTHVVTEHARQGAREKLGVHGNVRIRERGFDLTARNGVEVTVKSAIGRRLHSTRLVLDALHRPGRVHALVKLHHRGVGLIGERRRSPETGIVRRRADVVATREDWVAIERGRDLLRFVDDRRHHIARNWEAVRLLWRPLKAVRLEVLRERKPARNHGGGMPLPSHPTASKPRMPRAHGHTH